MASQNTVDCSNPKTCGLCSKPAKLTCSRCSKIRYCSKECQRTAWKSHKPLCNSLSLTPSSSNDELPPLPRLVRRTPTTLPILVLRTSSPNSLHLSGVHPSHRQELPQTLPTLASIVRDQPPALSPSSVSSHQQPLLHLKLTNILLSSQSKVLPVFLCTLSEPSKLQTLTIEFADSFERYEPSQDVACLEGDFLRMGWKGAVLGSMVLPLFDRKRMEEVGLRLEEVVLRVKDERLREDFEEGVLQLLEGHHEGGMRVRVEAM